MLANKIIYCSNTILYIKYIFHRFLLIVGYDELRKKNLKHCVNSLPLSLCFVEFKRKKKLFDFVNMNNVFKKNILHTDKNIPFNWNFFITNFFYVEYI